VRGWDYKINEDLYDAASGAEENFHVRRRSPAQRGCKKNVGIGMCIVGRVVRIDTAGHRDEHF